MNPPDEKPPAPRLTLGTATPEQLAAAVASVFSRPEFLARIRDLNERWALVGKAFRRLEMLGSALVQVGSAIPHQKGLESSVEQVRALANLNWYMDLELPWSVFQDAGEAACREDIQEADRIMAEHFESRYAEVRQQLHDRLPKRWPVLGLAFAAHERGDYGLAILAFLSQADGLSRELREGYFFARTRGAGQRATASYAARNARTDADWLVFAALEAKLAIMDNLTPSTPDDGSLNRHAVMHGEAVNYGSRTNSLKALSLLHYVAVTAESS
jgi:hypothetical protein